MFHVGVCLLLVATGRTLGDKIVDPVKPILLKTDETKAVSVVIHLYKTIPSLDPQNISVQVGYAIIRI